MTELAHRPAGALAVAPSQTDWTPDQRAALDSLGIDDTATAGDLKVFLTYAQRTGLDPFARQIYLIGRNGKENVNGQWRWRKRWTIQVGIDGFRVIAARSGKYRGQTSPQWCGDDAVWRDVWLAAEPPAAVRVGVRHADYPDPVYAVALLGEYAPRNESGALTGMWARMPSLMLAKVAEALALRKAFPHDLSGLYIAEEMDQRGPAAPPVNPPPGRTLSELVDAADPHDVDGLRAVWREAAAAGLLDERVVDAFTGETMAFREYLSRLVEAAAPDDAATAPVDAATAPRVVDVELPDDGPQTAADDR